MNRLARLALLSALLPAAAFASPVVARISPSGLAFVEKQVPSLIPSELRPDDRSVELWQCDGSPATIEQADTRVNLSLDQLEISLPSAGVLRVEVTLSAEATGEARLNKIYACYGQEVCQDRVALRNAHAVIDFSARVVGGKPKIQLLNVDLGLHRDDVEMELSGCNPGELVIGVLDGIKDVGLDIGIWALGQIAENKLGPMLEEAVGSLMTVHGSASIFDFTASLTALELAASGITIGGEVDIASPFPAASCLGGGDPGEPSAAPGPAPDLTAGPNSDVAVGVNLGVVQDIVYHLWRSGYLCIGPGKFASFGIDLAPELAKMAAMPGIPVGTRMSLEINAARPPRVEAGTSDQGRLTLRLVGIGADLRALYPDNTNGNLHLDLDATATATVSIDPTLNAIVVSVDRISIDKLTARDELGLTAYGFDIGRVRRTIEQQILPKVAASIGKLPLTGPVFGGILDTYVILRGLDTTPSFLVVKADLFRAPADDHEAPTTRIAARPDGPARPSEARVTASGTDALVPTELLEYRVTIDGTAGEPTFVNTFTVGEEGKTQTYQVRVQAIDLAGNEDPVGATAEVRVDGIAPQLVVTTQLRGVISEARPTFAWTATDDTSAPAAMTSKLEIFHQPEHAGGEFEETRVSEQSYDGAAHSTELGGLEAGKQYRVVVTVSDQAGNADSSSFIFTVSADAGGGCNVGGAGGGAGLLALELLGLVRRRRVTPTSSWMRRATRSREIMGPRTR